MLANCSYGPRSPPSLPQVAGKEIVTTKFYDKTFLSYKKETHAPAKPNNSRLDNFKLRF